EGARRRVDSAPRLPEPLPPRAACAVDDLLDALVAHPERRGDLAQRSAVEMETPDRRVVVDAPRLRRALGGGKLRCCFARLVEQSTVERHAVLRLSALDRLVYRH